MIFWWKTSGSGGTADYPVASNVKFGVTYDFGSLTGTYNPYGTGGGTGQTAQLSERTRYLIEQQIKSNIVAELAAIRTGRQDPTVGTDPPKEYFIYDGAHTYQCPAIFIVVDSGEVPDDRTGTNYISAVMKIFVTAVVEDSIEKSLTIKCERYQAALFKILHETIINDPVDNVKIQILCKRFQYSQLYTKSRKAENMSNFRKEVAIELEVKHWENPIS